MIHYHGGPATPETAAVKLYQAGHAFLSYSTPYQLPVVASVCQSFALDNGAFPAWTSGKPISDWSGFYAWAAKCQRIPNCDFAVIPDVIDGDEDANDALLREWPLGKFFGAPVWHMHESLERLQRLVREWPRVCLGSSGAFRVVGTSAWWIRMDQAMDAACDSEGRPLTKLHGLRMLNPKIFGRLPLASADSTNASRNIGIDKAWRGTYPPATREARAMVIRDRIESNPSAARWVPLEDRLW
jgi:hypothetical protein